MLDEQPAESFTKLASERKNSLIALINDDLFITDDSHNWPASAFSNDFYRLQAIVFVIQSNDQI